MDREIPFRFEVTNSASQILSEYSDLAEGDGSGVTVSVAGRLMLRRDQGKIVFGVLQDSTERIQLFASEKSSPDFELFSNLHLGDWLGVTGEVIKTKRGEISVRVDSWVRLAEAKRSFPDKWHGISDTDIRYRQRYVDLWVTEESRETFKTRSRIISLIRKWLENRDFMEVETPVFHPIPGGAAARHFQTHQNVVLHAASLERHLPGEKRKTWKNTLKNTVPWKPKRQRLYSGRRDCVQPGANGRLPECWLTTKLVVSAKKDRAHLVGGLNTMCSWFRSILVISDLFPLYVICPSFLTPRYLISYCLTPRDLFFSHST